jgi:acyl dehydratase
VNGDRVGRNRDPETAAIGQRGWWFDDATPGSTVRHRGGRTVSADEHARLAWLTDNASDIHGDEHRAAAGTFGEPVVLGALSAAIVIGLAGPASGAPAAVTRALPGGWRRIALRGLVRAGDTLYASSTFHATQAEVGGGLVERTIEGRNQRGEIVVVIEEQCWAPGRDR